MFINFWLKMARSFKITDWPVTYPVRVLSFSQPKQLLNLLINNIISKKKYRYNTCRYRKFLKYLNILNLEFD